MLTVNYFLFVRTEFQVTVFLQNCILAITFSPHSFKKCICSMSAACARHHSRCWEYSGEQGSLGFSPGTSEQNASVISGIVSIMEKIKDNGTDMTRSYRSWSGKPLSVWTERPEDNRGFRGREGTVSAMALRQKQAQPFNNQKGHLWIV